MAFEAVAWNITPRASLRNRFFEIIACGSCFIFMYMRGICARLSINLSSMKKAQEKSPGLTRTKTFLLLSKAIPCKHSYKKRVPKFIMRTSPELFINAMFASSRLRSPIVRVCRKRMQIYRTSRMWSYQSKALYRMNHLGRIDFKF